MLAGIENLNSPEMLIQRDWFEMRPGAWAEVKELALDNGLKVPTKPYAIRGGKMFGLADFPKESLRTETLPGYFSSEREIAIIPVKDASNNADRLLFVTSKEFNPEKD